MSLIALKPGLERMREDIVRDPATLGNTFRLIENPMDTQVNATLPVFFLSLR